MRQTTKLILSFAFFASLITVAFAAPLLSPSSFNVNEQTAVSYTFHINNTDNSNITMVNVTIPAGFSYSGTQSVSLNSSLLNVSSSTDSSGNTTITWSNESESILNSSIDHNNASFSFTATANTTTIGTFIFTVRTLTSSETSSFDLNVTVNDTTAPTVTFVSPTPSSSSSFLKSTSIFVNATATDNFNVSEMRIWLFNRTGGVVGNTNFSAAVAGNNNFTSLSQGNYSFNVTAIDSAGNNGSSATRTVVLDTTAPIVEIDDSEDTTDSTIVGEIRITETGSGISGECQVSGSADITTGSGALYQEFEDEDFDCGEEESYTVTCTDKAGNSGNDTMTLETLACEDDDDDDSSSSSSSSGGGGAATQTWTTTYASDSKELSEMGAVEKTLAEKSRIRVLIDGDKHHVGLKSVTSSAATIEVSSTPQTSKINIGQSQKFDVENDGLYDLQVTVMSIEDKLAKIVILAVKEPVMALSGKAADESTASGASAAKTANGTAGAATDIEKPLSKNWIWAVSALVVVAVAIGIFIFFRNRNKVSLKRKR